MTSALSDTPLTNANFGRQLLIALRVPCAGDSDARVLTLAEQIIAAMPERIKHEADDLAMQCQAAAGHSPGAFGQPSDGLLHADHGHDDDDDDGSSAALAVLAHDTFMEPLLHDTTQLPSHSIIDAADAFCFEFSDQTYRYHDAGTPGSSLSPASSSGPLPSPASYTTTPTPSYQRQHHAPAAAASAEVTASTTSTSSALASAAMGGVSGGSPSPPPTTAEFSEFLQASAAMAGNPFESAFSNLTLTDVEQRELYEAAKCIQKAYRSYKGRKKLEEDKERSAAIVIQNYYRRYKQVIVYYIFVFVNVIDRKTIFVIHFV